VGRAPVLFIYVVNLPVASRQALFWTCQSSKEVNLSREGHPTKAQDTLPPAAVVRISCSSTHQTTLNMVCSSHRNSRRLIPDTSASGGYRNSMQGARMSGRSTPLAGYPDYSRMEGKTGWLAAFGTGGYPDGKTSRSRFALIGRTTTSRGIRRQLWTYQNKGVLTIKQVFAHVDLNCAESYEECRPTSYG